MGQLSGDENMEMSKSWALPVWRPGGSGERIYDGVWSLWQRGEGRFLWECIGSHRREGRPGSQ